MLKVKELKRYLDGVDEDAIVLIQSLDDCILKTVSNISSTVGNLYQTSSVSDNKQEYVILSTHSLISRCNE